MATGYGQVKVHPNSKEKSPLKAYLSFASCRLGCETPLQCSIDCLNPENGTDFVSVYIEYTLVFIDTGRSLERVIEHLNEAGQLLNLVKCHSVIREVENIGYLIITIGLFQPNRHLLAVKNFPVPGGAKVVQQFIGLASYYHILLSDCNKFELYTN